MRGCQNGQEILTMFEKLRNDEGAEGDENISNLERTKIGSLSLNLIKEAKTLKKIVQDAKKERKKLMEMGNLKNEEYVKLQKQVLNLTNLTFEKGAHVMSNEKCDLPKGSTKRSEKGYEEVFIPAPTLVVPKIPLKKISEMPEWAQPVFFSIKQLNLIQSEVYDCAFKTPNNMLVCAPTGAGKTIVALLTILQTIGMHRNKGTIDKNKFKVVYIAPMKALVNEIVQSF
jgi:pre-mRNA-splicing helicase BRR2